MFNRLFGRVYTKNALNPQAISGSSAVIGNIVDRLGYGSALVGLITGAATGTPTGCVLAIKVEHGNASNLSDAADFVTLTSVGTASAPPTASENMQQVNLDGAKRYIRVTVTPTFTGGTAPTILTGASLVLGDYANGLTTSAAVNG